ncbi:hypothetical protein F2Q68_00033148 [Brassica cretica]|uniref:Uncharacterized protein n=1 Tax=Brassica cretica TaxID=69181 RepID=A0A8S9GHV8_BRACR|nr:hypothetical protein F2Q68_00033148 [Brassica cretica]
MESRRGWLGWCCQRSRRLGFRRRSLKLPLGFGGAWKRETSIYFRSELWSSGSEFLWVCGVAMETTVLGSILGVLERAGSVCSLSWEFRSSL